jgi:cellulose synthase/poly-beta-1,6-N-acetylglucosamine synthase-like glycosyltransferase
MYVLRKDLFLPVAADTILDDFVISMNVIRQGKRVVFEPAAVADENATPSARSEFRRRMRVSAGAVQSLVRRNFPPVWRPVELWQYVSHKLLRWCIPLLLAALFVMSACLLSQGVVYQIAFAVQALGYLLALAGAVSVRIRQTRLVGIPFYFVLTFIAMFAGMFKGLFFRQSGAWAKTERTAAAA